MKSVVEGFMIAAVADITRKCSSSLKMSPKFFLTPKEFPVSRLQGDWAKLLLLVPAFFNINTHSHTPEPDIAPMINKHYC